MLKKLINLEIKNISNANDEILKEFYSEIHNLHPKFVELINKYNLKIILANKMSDVVDEKFLDGISEYNENYTIENIDKTTRGISSDSIENGSICIFINTAQNIIGTILYHEIGHLVDFYKNFETPIFSTNEKFVKAYEKDLKLNWNKIKNDNRFRLIHYIQNSTPYNLDKLAMMETFAHCFARSFGKIDDADIVSEYFINCLNVTKEFVEEFLRKQNL